MSDEDKNATSAPPPPPPPEPDPALITYVKKEGDRSGVEER